MSQTLSLEIIVDGTNLGTQTQTNAVAVGRSLRSVSFGQWGSFQPSDLDIRNIMVGTTGFGSSDVWNPTLTTTLVPPFDSEGGTPGSITVSGGVITLVNAGVDDYGLKDLGANYSELFIQFDLRVRPVMVSEWTGDYVDVWLDDGNQVAGLSNDSSGGWYWDAYVPGNPSGGPTANTWMTVQMRVRLGAIPPPDVVEEFDSAPIAGGTATCSTPVGPLVSTDGASQGPSSLKIDPTNHDSWTELVLTGGAVPSDVWVYTSFAFYLPSWSNLWAAGAAYTPFLLSLDDVGLGPEFVGFYLVPTSASTGVIRYFFPDSTTADSPSVPDGQWVAVEIAAIIRSTTPAESVRYWINGTDSGQIDESLGGGSGGDGINAIYLGDSSWSYLGEPDGTLLYYVDDFHESQAGRIGPVSLASAFFNGIGSGTDLDACTGSPVSPHPVDDPSYTVLEGHPLHVAAPGVLGNDVSPTTAVLVSGPTHGTVVLNADGSFVYTPDAGYVGADTFTYTGNGGGTATVTVTMTVAPLHPLFHGEPFFKGFG